MIFGTGARRITLLAMLVVACRGPETNQPLPETTTEPSQPFTRSTTCPLISSEEASAALGETVTAQFGPPSDGCTLIPASNAAGSIVIRRVLDTANFYQLTTQPDAVMYDIGDRAVWMPTTRELHVVDGNRTIVIKMSTVPMKTSDLMAKSRAIAQAILARP